MKLHHALEWIRGGMDIYAAGGTGWELEENIVVARDFDAVDDQQGNCRLVYAWVEMVSVQGDVHSRDGFDTQIMCYARGRITGDKATVETDILKMTDDLMQALVVGLQDRTHPAAGRLVVSGSVPVRVSDNDAHTLVTARMDYFKSVELEAS